MPLIRTTEPIFDYKGDPHKEPNISGEALTFRDIAWFCLNNYTMTETPDGAQKLQAFKITNLLFKDATAEIDDADLDIIKERSGLLNSALCHGRICEIISRARQVPTTEQMEEMIQPGPDEAPADPPEPAQ